MKPKDVSVSVVQSDSKTLSVLIQLKVSSRLFINAENGFAKVDEKDRRKIQNKIKTLLESVDILEEDPWRK